MRTTTRETDDLVALQARLATLKWRMSDLDRYTGKFQLYDICGLHRGEFTVSEAEDMLDNIGAWLEEDGR